jgi:hypothetical protein
MKIEQGLLSDLTNDEADALRQMAFAILVSGEIPLEATRLMREWVAIQKSSVTYTAPLGAFLQVSLLSLLLREEEARRADAKIPEDDVKAQLKRLSRHFGEPVMPIGRYCHGLRAWASALQDRVDRKREELFPGIGYYGVDPALKVMAEKAWADYRLTKEKFADPHKTYRDAGMEPDARCHAIAALWRYEDAASAAQDVFQSISRSHLLGRVLYSGEKVRTVQCPLHKGEWDGQAMLHGCPHQCDGTGWLREP